MEKATGARSNLACDYGYYHEKENLYPSESKHQMSSAVLEEFIRQ